MDIENVKTMTEAEIVTAAENGEFDDDYAMYIEEYGDRLIGNGDALLRAMEEGYLWDDFIDHITCFAIG